MDERQRWAQWIREEPGALTLVYASSRHVIIEVSPQGRVVVRENGGPLFHMGSCMNFFSETVKVWEQPEDRALHRRMLAVLLDVGFPEPKVEPVMAWADERGDSVVLRHRDGAEAKLLILSRLMEVLPALRELTGVFGVLAHSTQTTPPTHTLPNPETDRWEGHPRPLASWLESVAPVPEAKPSRWRAFWARLMHRKR